MASLKQLLAQSPPRTIAVIRTDRVGDLILSTPLLTAVRKAYPKATILGLFDSYCSQVLQGAGLCDVLADYRTDKPWPGEIDLAIALAPRSECLKAARRIGASLRLGYVYANRPLMRLAAPFWLTHYEVVNVKPPHQVPHEVEQLDLLARRLGLPSTLDFPLTVGLSSEKRPGTLAFHLGDRWLVSGWTFEDLRELLRQLRRFGAVKVTAGPREEKLVAENGLQIEGVELCFGQTFAQWADHIGSAELLISPDTGAVHLAAAVGTPVVVAYEASTYEHCSRQWAPWKISHRSVAKASPAETIPKLLSSVEDLLSTSRNGAS